MGKTFSIGQLGKAAGLKPHTIRYYERRGLLPKAPRSQSGYRRYYDSDLRQLCMIIAAKELGFTLREIASIAAEQKQLPLRALLKPRLDAKRVEVDQRLQHLRILRRKLQNAHRKCGRSCICINIVERKRGGL